MPENNYFLDIKRTVSAKNLFFASLSVFFIFAAHYLQINRSGTGLELPFNTMGWIPLSFAIGTGLYVIARGQAFIHTPLTTKLAVIVCLLVLPIFLPSANQDAVLDRMLGLMAGLILFICLQQFRFEKDQKILLLLLVIVAVWVEMLLGWDRFMRSLGYWVSESRPPWQGDPHGVFQQRNVYASFIATGIVLSAYLLGYASKIHNKAFQSYFPVLLLLPLAGIHLINAMYSRTGWFGLIVGVVLVLPFLVRYSARYISVLWVISLLAGFILTLQLEQNEQWDAPEKAIATIEGLRQVHFPQTIDMIMERPLLGYGYGTFESAYLNFTADKFAAGASDLPGISRLDHPHNELLFWAAEGGFYALILVLAAAWFVWQRVAALPWLHRLAAVGLFFPIVLHTQVEYPFYQSVIHWIIFVLYIFWIDSLGNEEKVTGFKSVLLIRLGAFIVPVVTTIFMITTLQTGYLLSRFEGDMNPDVQALSDITNPVIYQDRINWAVMSRLVLAGAINGRPEFAEPFIQWGPQLLDKKPRPNFYRFLILAYHVAGDEAKMLETQARARHLFPETRFELPNIEGSLNSPVPFDAISR